MLYVLTFTSTKQTISNAYVNVTKSLVHRGDSLSAGLSPFRSSVDLTRSFVDLIRSFFGVVNLRVHRSFSQVVTASAPPFLPLSFRRINTRVSIINRRVYDTFLTVKKAE